MRKVEHQAFPYVLVLSETHLKGIIVNYVEDGIAHYYNKKNEKFCWL